MLARLMVMSSYNLNIHSPGKIDETLPMLKDSTAGEHAYYKLVCKCGAVELYGSQGGLMASTSRCYSA